MVFEKIKGLLKKKEVLVSAAPAVTVTTAKKSEPTKKTTAKKVVAKKAPVKKAATKKIVKTVKKAEPKKKVVAKKVPAKKVAIKKKVTAKAKSPTKAPAKTAKKATTKKGTVEYENRFQKFYDLNKDRINSERRSKYEENVESGLCVRCKKKAVKGIKLCKYHRDKQREYNQNR